MKKIHFILVAMFVLSVAAVLSISPSKAVSQKKINSTGNSMPDSVKQVLSNSCIGCHADGGKGSAMYMWNFSVWDTYSAEKQSKKANAICNAITKGSMPPESVKKATPEKIPTAAQKEIVCKWAASLKAK